MFSRNADRFQMYMLELHDKCALARICTSWEQAAVLQLKVSM